MIRTIPRLLIGAVLGIAASNSHAVTVVMEPDAFASGTDVSNAWAAYGITLSAIERFDRVPMSVGRVLSVTSPFAVTGTRGFGFDFSFAPGSSSYWANVNNSTICVTTPERCADSYPDDGFRAMRVDFSRPVDSVEIFGGHNIDPIGFYALNQANQIVGHCYGYYGNGTDRSCFTPLWNGNYYYSSVSMSRPTRDIYSIVIGGVIGGSGIDMIRTTVPEPGTLALFGLGLAGIGLARRRGKSPQ